MVLDNSPEFDLVAIVQAPVVSRVSAIDANPVGKRVRRAVGEVRFDEQISMSFTGDGDFRGCVGRWMLQ